MARNRGIIGIKVEFRYQASIAALALGAGDVAAAALAGLGVNDFYTYLSRAFIGGGYEAPLAIAIYRLRTNPHPNFIFLAGGMASPDRIIIHFHNNDIRVSKNMKELSYNSALKAPLGILPPPGVLPNSYSSIKSIINAQFAALALPFPDSATVVTSDELQTE